MKSSYIKKIPINPGDVTSVVIHFVNIVIKLSTQIMIAFVVINVISGIIGIAPSLKK